MRNLNVGNDFAFQNKEAEDVRDKVAEIVHTENEPGGKAEGKADTQAVKEEGQKGKKKGKPAKV